MKIGLIKERKTPPDRRVVLSPQKAKEVQMQFEDLQFVVEPSDIRIFSDEAYAQQNLHLESDLSNCDVLLGVKEVPIDSLIPHTSYFFFSHTIKKQPYNRNLLKAILDKNIQLYDHEVVTDSLGNRLIGFGRYAGLVGAYNGFRALGLRDRLFSLSKVDDLADLEAVKKELDAIRVPNIKICLSGLGKVAKGAKEILDHLKIRQVGVEEYLSETFQEPVYTIIHVLDYNRRKDGEPGKISEFFLDPAPYESDFMRFAKVTDFFIAGHFYGDNAPYLFTRKDARHPDFKINLVADISCDIDGPVASTLRASTIEDPFYGYDPQTESEVAFDAKNAITVMAVDNLPCELPKDASEGFGQMFTEHVIPAFFNGDLDGILERARMTKAGKLTPRYSYLQDFVEGKE
ncbi:NAD(P)-dependent oxidoreductase [Psychroflexus sediminis]|uniref:Alanine dehydrogenase/PNT, N-terminal domain n=1 Tax=Psychroflexus sediminis TaxID=470826 RepID=A0A1G7VD01_9FLAO|nr:NAD(P)-dependent oxidoreductase [Psychroflexus sediminis]SDG56820.1 Alanine dehydrogenase/PNT, N-terminal domain [Psychroflexus sediminis]